MIRNKIEFKVKSFHNQSSDFDFNSVALLNIKTYDQLLAAIKNDKTNMFLKFLYKLDYFKNNNIIIFKKWETSGSNKLIVKSLDIDNNVLIVNIEKTVPEIGTADMFFWFFVIEYKKPEEIIKDICVNIITKKS